MPILRTTWVSSFLAILLALLSSRPAAAQTPNLPNAMLDGQIVLVQFTPDTSEAQRQARIAANGGTLLTWMPQIHVAEIRLPAAEVAAAGLSPLAAPEINFVEPDLPVLGGALPNDPAFASAATSYAFSRIEAPAAWAISTGSDQVTIAVVDTGIKLDHPEFSGRLTAGYDFVNNHNLPNDDSGHGTHVAGLIAAALNNGQGSAGVCPTCRLMPVKVLGASEIGSMSHLVQGILFAVDHGADIINLSLSSRQNSSALAVAIDYARRQDVVIVAAAGNGGLDQSYHLAALEGVIAVGATTAQDAWWEWSNFGSYVDLSAPGDLVYSTYHEFNNTFGGYTFLSGTSMAAPLVSGLAGLVLSVDPQLNAEGVAAALTAGADDLGAPGRDPYFGAGRINAYRTLSLLAETRTTANAGPETARVFLPTIQN